MRYLKYLKFYLLFDWLINLPFFRYFRFFYRYLGASIFVALSLNILVAVLDGIGLTMFLPLLNAAADTGNESGPEMGDMKFVLDGMRQLGLGLDLVTVLFVMLFFFCLKGLAKFVADFYKVVLQQRFANRMRLGLMKLLSGYDYGAFTRVDSGRIQNTFSAEIGRIGSGYRSYFNMYQNGLMTLVYVGLAYAANPRFAAIVALGGLLSNLIFNRIYKVTKTASRRITRGMSNFQGFLVESVHSFKFLKATNLIESFKKKIDHSIVEVEKQQRKVGVMSAIASAIREPLIIAVVVGAILLQVLVFGESLGLIILSLLFFYRGLTSLTAVQNAYNQFLGTAGSIENMEAFTEELKEEQEERGVIPHDGLQSSVEVENLVFGYDGYPIFSGFSAKIPKFSTIGVVGESGTGKTTLVNLLCGLLPADPGMIYVDGKDITKIDKTDFRAKVGYVTQEPHVFADTIYNNVSFWAPDTPGNREKVHNALRMAHALDFVEELKEGQNTLIGINGVNLSGGQRQRISIARELYRDVDILILDEATSALDSQSEKLIQENIDSLSGSLTMIVIAHRLSTVAKADQIIYLKPGGKYEIGTFDGLRETSPSFRKMVSLQMV